ncbi:MAG: T9SS type A sorting domain-containing protein, partial [Bacteroidetes bacterium]|nr:T9SS type A sorting domain-containing protein [Bacteroidota bacterium]
FTAYDDGTNGDKTAGDGIYTAKYMVKEGSWEWGATDKGSWIIQGPNRTFTMSSSGSITGDTVYGVAKLGALIDLTFNVDMSDTIVNSEGVYAAGNFMAYLQNPIGNWNKDTLKLDRVGSTKIYSKTVKIYAGNYQFKYYNGKGNADDSRGENWNFQAGGCGSPNGLGGYNRNLDLRGKTSAQVLPVYMWNRCATSTFGVAELPAGSFSVFPNPGKGQFDVTLNEGTIANVHVTDLAGRSIRSFRGLNTRSFSMKQTLSSGLYLVTITDQAGRSASVKVVVE